MGNYEDVDGDLNSMKLKIPNFQGKNDPEAYKVSTSGPGSGKMKLINKGRTSFIRVVMYKARYVV
jgi:hypothetical protein